MLREKIKGLGITLGFEVAEEWTPEPLRKEDRREVYIQELILSGINELIRGLLSF